MKTFYFYTYDESKKLCELYIIIIIIVLQVNLCSGYIDLQDYFYFEI